MKPVDVKPRAYITYVYNNIYIYIYIYIYVVENNHKNPKFKVRNHLRISKYKNNFAKL